MKQGYSQTFEQFWQAYPKRAGENPKQAAWVSFQRATKTTDPTAIISAAQSFAKQAEKKVGTEFIPMASTWLNQRRWADYSPATTTPPAAEKVFVEVDTPQWKAWRAIRSWPQTDHRIDGHLKRGWFFPTEWPQGSQ